MNLIVTPDRDRDPKKPGDYGGAFKPESRRLAAFLTGLGVPATVLRVDMGQGSAGQRSQLVRSLSSLRPGTLAHLAILCHGWRTGIQVGWSVADVPTLADALAAIMAPNMTIALYACSTERDAPGVPADAAPGTEGTMGDGGFADTLRDTLAHLRPDWMGWVDGHTRSGHCTSNPRVRRMDGPACAGSNLCVGGDWLVDPSSPLWREWDRRLGLRSERGANGVTLSDDLRFRYPHMTREQVLADLAASTPASTPPTSPPTSSTPPISAPS